MPKLSDTHMLQCQQSCLEILLEVRERVQCELCLGRMLFVGSSIFNIVCIFSGLFQASQLSKISVWFFKWVVMNGSLLKSTPAFLFKLKCKTTFPFLIIPLMGVSPSIFGLTLSTLPALSSPYCASNSLRNLRRYVGFCYKNCSTCEAQPLPLPSPLQLVVYNIFCSA